LGGGLGALGEFVLGSPLTLVVLFVVLAGGFWGLSDRMLSGPSDPAAGQAQDNSGRIRGCRVSLIRRR
jgi:hypothetical protein